MKRMFSIGMSVVILLSMVACQSAPPPNYIENAARAPDTSSEPSLPALTNAPPAVIFHPINDGKHHVYKGVTKPGEGGAAPLPGNEADAKGLSGGFPVQNGPYNPNFHNKPGVNGKMIPSTTKKSWIDYNGPTTPIIVADRCYIVHKENATMRDWYKEYGQDQGYVIRDNKIFNCDGGGGVNTLQDGLDKPATLGVHHNMIPRDELLKL